MRVLLTLALLPAMAWGAVPQAMLKLLLIVLSASALYAQTATARISITVVIDPEKTVEEIRENPGMIWDLSLEDTGRLLEYLVSKTASEHNLTDETYNYAVYAAAQR